MRSIKDSLSPLTQLLQFRELVNNVVCQFLERSTVLADLDIRDHTSVPDKRLPNSSLTLSTEDLIRFAMSMKVTIDAVMDKGSIMGRDGD